MTVEEVKEWQIYREKIVLEAMCKERPFVMTRQRFIECGCEEEYDGYRALGLHECANCHTDINETWEYDCIAYPAHKDGYPAFLCMGCYDIRTEREKRKSKIYKFMAGFWIGWTAAGLIGLVIAKILLAIQK